MTLKDAPTELLQNRVLMGRLASKDLISFSQLTMPDPMAPADTTRTRFDCQPHHQLLADKLMAVERGEIKRLLVVMPRRHGKTEMAVRRFVPWYCGRHPDHPVLVASYNDSHAQEHGRACRDIFASAGYRAAFASPRAQVRNDSNSAERLQLHGGATIGFVGRGGAITGRGCMGFLVDDPLKDAEEAQSKVIRDKLWEWYHNVVNNSFNTGAGWLVLIQTRWHADDLVGRLTDPSNDCYDPNEASKWTILHLPALAEDNDPLERKRDEALWEARLPASIYISKRESRDITVRTSFATMDQGRPAPETGAYFEKPWLRGYTPDELPTSLSVYAASDHAVGTADRNDSTCLMPAGMCEQGILWILPDVVWGRIPSDEQVRQMVIMLKKRRPIVWWAEKEKITKAIGPFLRAHMLAEGAYGHIEEVTPVKDKQARAQSIKGRMSMGLVRFPTFAPWWPEAQQELLTFPNATHDDFVDTLAWLGLGIDRMVKPAAPKPPPELQEWQNRQQDYALEGAYAGG